MVDVLSSETGIPYEFRIPEFYNRLSCSGDGTDIPAPAKGNDLPLIQLLHVIYSYTEETPSFKGIEHCEHCEH